MAIAMTYFTDSNLLGMWCHVHWTDAPFEPRGLLPYLVKEADKHINKWLDESDEDDLGDP